MIKRLAYAYKKNKKRLLKTILSEWTQINMSDPNLIQYITDAMTYNYPVQINYEGSGWRTIQPYGWNTSQQQNDGSGNNILLMCYKDTGEIRSYRLDKISDVYIDYENQVATNDNQQMQDEQTYDSIYNEQNTNLDMPLMPEENDNKESPGIYDNQLSELENETPEEDNSNEDNSKKDDSEKDDSNNNEEDNKNE